VQSGQGNLCDSTYQNGCLNEKNTQKRGKKAIRVEDPDQFFEMTRGEKQDAKVTKKWLKKFKKFHSLSPKN